MEQEVRYPFILAYLDGKLNSCNKLSNVFLSYNQMCRYTVQVDLNSSMPLYISTALRMYLSHWIL